MVDFFMAVTEDNLGAPDAGVDICGDDIFVADYLQESVSEDYSDPGYDSDAEDDIHVATTEADLDLEAPDAEDDSYGTFSARSHTNIPAEVTIVVVWPADPHRIPAEVYQLICSYLPHSSVLAMRLVNKAFEVYVTPYLYRQVVVPFKSELYGIISEEGEESAQGVMLQDVGMRVFEGYGQHIRKFAMSFEYDQFRFIKPPTKSEQEAIVSFWGIYRWPHQNYNRYKQLEGLELQADETRSMSTALRCINSALELGLSIDGGLGYMAGPDVNILVEPRGVINEVFGSRFEPESSCMHSYPAIDLIAPAATDSEFSMREKMLKEKGYEGEELESAIRIMQQTETFNTVESNDHLVLVAKFQREYDEARQSRRRPLGLGNDAINSTSLLEGEYEDKEKEKQYLVKPNHLSKEQREVLLETAWAQRAFVQSYTLAITDNPSVFQNIKTLTIARLPDYFLQDLNREAFWDCLEDLEKLHLAVIPSWREVSKLPTSYVQDSPAVPSHAIAAAFEVLKKQISHRDNIKTLHFEWLSGGEDATGIFNRNKHVMPAPVVIDAGHMLNTVNLPSVSQGTLLGLPHVKHLTLKNCYLSPHVMKLFLGGFARPSRSALETLVFKSVSLTAPVPADTTPMPPIPPPVVPAGLPAANVPAPAQPVAPPAHFAAAPAGPIPGGALHIGAAGAVHGWPGHAIPFIVLNAPPHANAAQAQQQLQQLQQHQAFMQQAMLLQIGAPLAAMNPNSFHNANDDQGDDDSEPWEPPFQERYARRGGSWVDIVETFTPSHYKSLNFRGEQKEDANAQYSKLNPSLIRSLRTLTFDSCGYVAKIPLDFNQDAVDPPADNNEPRFDLRRTTDTHNRMKQFANHMMSTSDVYFGTVMNFMNPIEQWQLTNGYFFELGWDSNSDRAKDASQDGVMYPGQGRFTGSIKHDDYL
ncbi:hypothetical protein BJ878DRAFT_128899 [Calycina marina]|uniref:F-box domain-containing protein n=1 Tax=Calycina marina TaxID=1763456 RepID=A0A9P7Z9H3_9HELO|nr:hypothetical protein BJ878DRAFT_128899 [Calycina marina]